MTFSNRPKCYGTEWEAYVDDEATSRGIDPKDWQSLEALEEELELSLIHI